MNSSASEEDFVTVPIMVGFDDREPPVGTMRIRKSALPDTPDFVFAIGYRALVHPKGPYELVAVSITSDENYAKFLSQQEAERDA